MRKLLATFLLFILVLWTQPVSAQCPCLGRTVVIKAPAVARTSTGELVGVATEFVITVAPGHGYVYVETWPLSQVDMQASARLAAQVAGKVLGVNMSHYDIFIQVLANSSIIGGPSAGGTMTVGIIAALKGWPINPKVMMTGMINPDGTIGPVGGILEKASAAFKAGAKLFLIPEGQEIQYVQITNRSSIGNVVNIVTVTKAVNVSRYAMERWNLKVLPVSSIYQAVYYFTGHSIPQPKPPKNVRVSTSFMKPYALSDYLNTTEYYRRVLTALKHSSVGYETYEVLMSSMKEAYSLLRKANSSLKRGMYYTSLSEDFQARIIIRHVEWFMNVSSPSNVERLVRLAQREVNRSEYYVSSIVKSGIRGVTMLQAVAAAQERVENARQNVKEAWKYYYNGDYWNAVGSAAYAYERAKTAVFWANLGKKFGRGKIIDERLVKTTARNYIDESNLIVTYIESMYGNVLGSGLSDAITRAEQYYEDGKYSAALFTAIEARVRGEVFLDTVGINNLSILKRKMEEMRRGALVSIGIAEEMNVTPILAIAYYEFGQSYALSGNLTDIEMAMVMFQYARETAGLFLTPSPAVVPRVGTSASLPTPQTERKGNTTQGTNQNVPQASLTGETSDIIVLLLVAFLMGLGIGRKL